MPTIQQSLNELSDYWRESTRPLASLLLIGPLLLCYELVQVWQPLLPRPATESWLRTALQWFGTAPVLLPLLTCSILLLAHYATRRPWHIPWNVFPAMICEAILGGVALVVVLQLLMHITGSMNTYLSVPELDVRTVDVQTIEIRRTVGTINPIAAKLSYIGTGIYEELFFRALMITPIAWILCRLGESRRLSLVAATVVSSLLFALAHYQTFAVPGEAFSWFTFIFRVAAGGLFATLYITRGLGITAGAHVTYDIIVQVSG